MDRDCLLEQSLFHLTCQKKTKKIKIDVDVMCKLLIDNFVCVCHGLYLLFK